MKRLTLGLLAATAVASAAHASVIIAPTGAIINTGGPGFGTLVETFNQAGLNSGYIPGFTAFDAYLATNPTHTDIFAGNEWFSNSGTTSASVTYDFGAVVSIDAMALWNEEISGIGLLDLLGSTDGVTFTAIATALAPTDNPRGVYGADIFGFASTTLRYLRLDMSECPQADPAGFDGCAIGEVAFRSAGVVPIPEPAALGLLGLGLLGTVLARRRKAR